MGQRKIGAVIALDGEQQFKSAVTACSKSLKTMQSALKLVETQTAGQKNSLEALQQKHTALNDVLDAAAKKQDAVADGLAHAQQDYEKIGNQLKDYRTALQGAQEKLSAMQSSGEATDAELREQEKIVSDLSRTIETGETAYERAGNRVEDWKNRLNEAQIETTRAEQALQETAEAMEQIRTATDGATNEMDEFGEEAHDAAGSTGELDVSLGSMVKNAAVGIAADAMQALAGKAAEAAKYVVDVGSSFEAAMSKVEALSGASATQMTQISDRAKELGSSTQFSATEVAEAFSYMSLAGWNTNEMLESIDGVVNLAAASQMDLAQASDMVTDYLSAFGLEAKDAKKMVDQMAYAQANSNTTTAQLGEAFGNCAANMNAAGQSMETTTAVLEAFANQGIKGSEAGTKLSAIMRDITAKMKDGAIQIGDTSVAVTDSQGNFRDLTDILVDVDAATQSMSDSERAAALRATFTSRSVGGLNMVLTEGVDKVQSYRDKLYDADGTAAKMAATMQDNLQGKITAFNSALEGLGIAIYEEVAAPLTGAVEFATSVISGLTAALTPAKDDLDNFLESVKASNDEASRSLEEAKATAAEAEVKTAKLEEVGSYLTSVIDNCSQFNQTDLSGTAGQMTADLSATAEDGFGALGSAAEDAAGKAEGLKDVDMTEASTNIKDALTDITENGFDPLSESATTAKESAEGIGESAEGINEAARALGYMSDEEEGVIVVTDAFTKSKITRMVNELAETVPEVADAWNETTGELRLTNEQLNSYVSNAIKAVKTEAYAKILKKAYEAQAESELNAAMAQSGLTKAQEEAGITAEELKRKINSQATSIYDANVVLTDAEAKVLDCSAAYEEANARVTEAATIAKTTEDAIKGLGVSEEELWGTTQEGTEANAEFGESIETVSEDLKKQQAATADLIKVSQEAKDKITDAFDSAKESAENAFSVNPFEAWTIDAENGMNKFLTAMHDQQVQMRTYADNLNVLRDHTAELSPEFIGYLEDMGVSGYQLVAELADAFRSDNIAQINTVVAAYTDAFDIQDQLTATLALDAIALQYGLDEFGSKAEEWTGLETAFNDMLALVEAQGGILAEDTKTAFTQAVENAKAAGVAIPDGLADEIRSSEDPALALQTATDKLNAAIQGQASGLLEVAKKAGLDVPANISAGITEKGGDVMSSYQALLSLMTGQQVEFETTGKNAGLGLGENAASGVSEKSGDVEKATTTVIDAAKKAGETSANMFKAPGRIAAMAFASGIDSNRFAVTAASERMASAAASSVNQYRNSFYNAGLYMMSGLASGIYSGASSAIRAAAYVASAALSAARATLGIHSPSKEFEQIGEYTIAGYVNALQEGAKDVRSAVMETFAPDKSDIVTSAYAAGTGTTTNTNHNETINFQIYQQPGQSAEELADLIEQRIIFNTERRRAAFS